MLQYSAPEKFYTIAFRLSIKQFVGFMLRYQFFRKSPAIIHVESLGLCKVNVYLLIPSQNKAKNSYKTLHSLQTTMPSSFSVRILSQVTAYKEYNCA